MLILPVLLGLFHFDPGTRGGDVPRDGVEDPIRRPAAAVENPQGGEAAVAETAGLLFRHDLDGEVVEVCRVIRLFIFPGVRGGVSDDRSAPENA